MNLHQPDSNLDPIRVAVLTISDTRTQDDDWSGDRIRELIKSHQHTCVASALVADVSDSILARVEKWLDDDNIDVIITTGGTGIAKRDVTINTLQPLLTNELEGFGELFRLLSYEEVGSIAMLSRATGGLVVRDQCETFLFMLPGSTNACEVAMEKLIGPELGHLVWERRK